MRREKKGKDAREGMEDRRGEKSESRKDNKERESEIQVTEKNTLVDWFFFFCTRKK